MEHVSQKKKQSLPMKWKKSLRIQEGGKGVDGTGELAVPQKEMGTCKAGVESTKGLHRREACLVFQVTWRGAHEQKRGKWFTCSSRDRGARKGKKPRQVQEEAKPPQNPSCWRLKKQSVSAKEKTSLVRGRTKRENFWADLRILMPQRREDV